MSRFAQVAGLRGMMVKFDQCRFGLVSKKEEKPVQKPTIFCTNMPSVTAAFQGKFCLGNHTQCDSRL